MFENPAKPLSITSINKSFGAKKVLNNVSIEVDRGEVFGLIGLNGAGKTTLIKIILGLLEQDSGSAFLFGKKAENPETRRNLSFLPEKFHPPALLKGKEFLSICLSYYRKKYNHSEAERWAEKLDLDREVLDHKVNKYSKGMGQKLGLLSAFLTNAPLLILDEPMSGLDPSARIRLKDSLLDYVKSGNTIFFSSHILSDIDEICGKIAIIHGHKVIFTGKPANFKALYKTASLERAFLNAIENSNAA